MTGGGDQALNFLYLVGCLVLVASALMVRRIPIGRGLAMFAAWVLIFAAMFAVFALRDDFLALGRRLIVETKGEGGVAGNGREIRIRKSLDGHFHVDASLNGTKVQFLVDSGATTTAISEETARLAHVVPTGNFPVLVQTANGIVTAQSATANTLIVGTIERRDMDVEISPALGTMDVLGMNFLSSLSSWGVQGQWLVLRP